MKRLGKAFFPNSEDLTGRVPVIGPFFFPTERGVLGRLGQLFSVGKFQLFLTLAFAAN